MKLNTLSIPNNHTDVDLRKVAYATFFYRNQEGLERRMLPLGPSVRGVVIPEKQWASCHPSYPSETMMERAKRLGIIDRWSPVIIFTMSNGHRLEFTGEKAVNLNKAWRARIYGKQSSKDN